VPVYVFAENATGWVGGETVKLEEAIEVEPLRGPVRVGSVMETGPLDE
jgi:hypothetical protein